jgi:hypothetical protein
LAAVAAATDGLPKDPHVPNGFMLITGLWSITVAIGPPCKLTEWAGGDAPKTDCPEPIEHFNLAFEFTYFGIMSIFPIF